MAPLRKYAVGKVEPCAVAPGDVRGVGRAGELVEPVLVRGGVAVGATDRAARRVGVGETRADVRLEPFDVALRLEVDDGHPDRGHGPELELRQGRGAGLEVGVAGRVGRRQVAGVHGGTIRHPGGVAEAGGKGGHVDAALRVAAQVRVGGRAGQHRRAPALLHQAAQLAQHVPLDVVDRDAETAVANRIEALQLGHGAGPDGDPDPGVAGGLQRRPHLRPHDVFLGPTRGVERLDEHAAAELRRIRGQPDQDARRVRRPGC